MMITAGEILFTLFLAAPSAVADTTITVPAGSRLQVETSGGSIAVETWSRNEVRVQASYGSRDQIVVESQGAVVRVRSERGGFSAGGIVDYRITAPAQMDLELTGLYTGITVDGARGRVSATTMQGDITLEGGVGEVALTSVQGRVAAGRVQGNVKVQTVAGDVHLRDVEGSVEAQTVSGSIRLEEVRSTNVDAATVSGPIFFDGSIVTAGRYSFTTHAGPITLAVQENLNATVTVALIAGSFSSTLGSLSSAPAGRGQRQRFVVGNGSATIELESFAGGISVVRRGEPARP